MYDLVFSSPNRDPTIRHAGRAHIRGQFRRIWRPRYLELLDNGMIRYYELPSTADVTLPEDSDLDHVNMIPKDTLLIYHARIIDVTTLRDLHVGLPGGSFGFLFRGQRSLTQELMVKSTEPNPPRDFFCAVSTLDEAQTWVVALQWAATMCQRVRRSMSSGSSGGSNCVVEQPGGVGGVGGNRSKQQQQQQHQHQRLLASASLSPSVKVNRKVVISPDNRSSSIDDDITIIEHGESSSVGEAPPIERPKKKKGRIIVTKVLWYRITKSKSSHSLQWEISYEIALLLLQPPRVEERRVLKTKLELIRMLQQMQVVLQQQDPEALKILESLKSTLASLPDFHKGCKPKEVTQSIPKVDKILRACSMNASIVNTKAFKSAFLLDANNTCDDLRIQEPTWWKVPLTIAFRKVRSIRADVNTDEFVKQWLQHTAKQQQQPPQKHIKALWLLQYPWMVMGGAGIGLVSLYPFFQVYQQNIPSVQIRVDVLALTWMAAAWAGKEYYYNDRSSRPRPSAAKRISSTTSTMKPTTLAGLHRAPSTTSASTELQVDDSDNESTDGEDIIDETFDASIHEDLDTLTSPLAQYPSNGGESCWSVPSDNSIFRVRGPNYLQDKVKIPSGQAPFECRGVDLWLADNPLRHIARHPNVMGGKLGEEDTFLVNFLLPFGNFVAYFTVPPLDQFPGTLASVWCKFVKGDQQYRDARLKLLPIVMEGPWIVKAAVGNGTAPALLGKVIPLQYYFQERAEKQKAVYEVDVIITASSIAKGILSVVKGHTKSLSIAFAFIIEAAEQDELPETALCSFQIHKLNVEHCPHLPECDLD
ncbi:unnamed protein product [Cylindrotheca closterium]|uniref:PH domain-containing protein n=1 Tax=Cylindrotheca closterium TaxID=2856 RepID=A0AAD2G406_9STRA|nr:unnamed protein product [Cylindrotheca closterium]